MKAVVAALLALSAPLAALAQSPMAGDERFAAVTVATGEGVEIVASNVVASNVMVPPTFGGRPPVAPCPVMVGFFTGRGKPMGSSTTVHLLPGASVSVPAAVPAPGLVQARVGIVGADSDAACAIRSNLEVYDLKSGATLFVVPGSACLGRGVCTGPLQ